MACEIHKNDIDVQFRITVNNCGVLEDVSRFTTTQFIFEKASGTLLTVNASFLTDGSDGILVYNTVAGDLNESGWWRIQVLLSNASTTLRTEIGKFQVFENLE